VARIGGYVAPPLDGIWASAPYLHNGSIPTIWHLLTPETRPETFDPEGYVPFSQPVILNTSHPGVRNVGHHFGAALSDADKVALMEFLKQL